MFHFISLFLSILYPSRCPLCDEPLPRSTSLACNGCKNAIPILKEPLCVKCGRPLSFENTLICKNCLNHPPSFSQGFSLWDYKNPAIRNSLHRFKYKGREEYAAYYAFKLYETFPFLWIPKRITALIPVPIHKNRYRKRGYNQAESIALELSKLCHIPVFSDLIIRIKNTTPQSQLNFKGRKENLKGAFLINPNSTAYISHLESVLLIDDIYTTGATADTCASLLKEIGISQVFFLSISSTGN